MCSGDYARFLGQRWGDYVVVTGVWGDLVLIHDPWHGKGRQKSVAWFAPRYDGTSYAYIA